MTSGVEPVKRFPLLTVIAKLDDESQSALKAAKYIAQAFKAVFPALWRIPVDELIPDQNEAVAQFSVELVGMPRSLGYTVLTGVKGFDTSIGSQTSIEFSGTTWQGHGYVLSFNGFINVIGGGYEEFSGKILITPGYEDPLIGLTCRMPRKGSYLTWEPKNGYVIELSASKMIP